MSKRFGSRERNAATLAMLAAAALSQAGCSKAKDALTGGGDSTTAGGAEGNVVGQVALDAGSTRLAAGPVNRLVRSVFNTSVSCSVKAYELTGSAAIATGTSSSDGKFTLKAEVIKAGNSYKVVTDCGAGKKFTAIIGADSKDPSTKTAAPVSAKSTLVAAQIIKAVVSAVESAIGTLPESVQAKIREVVLSPENVAKMVAAISSSVEEAIESGAMPIPSDTDASTIASSSESATSASTVASMDSAVTTAVGTVPASVSGAVDGASKAAAAFPACDSSLASSGVASELKCTAAVAKLMFNVLHFPVVVNVGTGGAFAGKTCDTHSTTGLQNEFLNALFTKGSVHSVTDDLCIIDSTVGRTDRNRSYSDTGGDHGGGPMFAETVTGVVSKGFLSTLGKAIYNGYQYNLTNLDQIVFRDDGMAMRMVNVRSTLDSNTSSNSGQFNVTREFYALGSNGNWSQVNSWPTCNSSPCDPHDMFDFTNGDWAQASADPAVQAIADALHDGDFVGKVFSKKFEGPIPSESDLTKEIVDSKVHSSYNPTGQQKFWVLYSERPKFDDAGCRDHSSTEICHGESGAEEPAITVNMTLSTPGANGTTVISKIDKATGTTGDFFVFPVGSGYGSVSGVLQFVKRSNGRIFTNELMHPRFVKVVMKTEECDGTHLPATGDGCAVGKMYNVDIDNWNCSGSNGCSPEVTYVDGSSALNPAGTFALSPRTEYNLSWGMNGVNKLVKMDNGTQKEITVAIDSTSGAISDPQLVNPGTAPGAGRYYLGQRHTCTMDVPNDPSQGWTCNFVGLYAFDGSGAPVGASGSLDTGLSKFPQDVGDMDDRFCYGGDDQNPPTCVDGDTVVMYSDLYLDDDTRALDFDPSVGSRQKFTEVAKHQEIDMGPANNPNFDCNRDPYWVDVNGDGVLACGGSNPDKTFQGPWDFGTYKAANPNAVLLQNQNTFQFGDPAGVKGLLTTAFGGWFDGNHSISSSTKLTGLQAFSLIFFFFEHEHNGGMEIHGLVPNLDDARFQTISAVFNGNYANGVAEMEAMNVAFSNAFLNYKQ